jgi:hypothetical protein
MKSKLSFSQRTWLVLFAKTKTSFKRTPYLQSRKSIQRILPSHVRYERNEKGSSPPLSSYFVRKTESGAARISPDEKTVEFTCKIEGSTLRVAFELQKMVDQNGPAL